jgi:NADH-quinone oxidoreductase subunit M
MHFQTLNDGVVPGALFVLLGVLDTRYEQPDPSFGGVRQVASPATFFMITMLAMAGHYARIHRRFDLSSTFTEVGKGWAIAATWRLFWAPMSLARAAVFYGPESKMTPFTASIFA